MRGLSSRRRHARHRALNESTACGYFPNTETPVSSPNNSRALLLGPPPAPPPPQQKKKAATSVFRSPQCGQLDRFRVWKVECIKEGFGLRV